MNRQIRRAQAKLDKKAEEEKARKKEARRDRITTLRERRVQRREEIKAKAPRGDDQRGAGVAKREPGQPLTPEERKRLPGRFSGAFMIATVFFIVLQASVPLADKNLQQSLVGAGFFLLFGYFSTLFLSRRGTPNPVVMTIISGVALAGGLLAASLFGTQQAVDWLLIGVGALGVVAGAFLGRLVFNAAPR